MMGEVEPKPGGENPAEQQKPEKKAPGCLEAISALIMAFFYILGLTILAAIFLALFWFCFSIALG